jgi:dTMP kinase
MKRINRSGRFIVLEGIDGSGTTTQSERLEARLRQEGYRVERTWEPTDRPVGKLIRRALTRQLSHRRKSYALSDETLALLFAADRLDHLRGEVLPALEAGKVVICDRYLLSSLAYQGIAVTPSWVEEINRFAIAPDLTLFLEVDPRIAARRRAKRGGAKELFDAIALQARIAERYQALARKYRAIQRVVRIDGTQTLDQVTAEALRHIHRVIGATMRP